MTAYDPALGARRSGLLQWLGFGQPDDEPARSNVIAARPLPLDDGWLPVKRRLLREIGEFLMMHELEVLPSTLAVAYDCVSGANSRLAQLILERSAAGKPVTLAWLEEVSRAAGTDRATGMLTSLMNRLEESLDDFGKTTRTAKSATREYNSALKQHVDELEQVSKAGVVISELATLTRAMMERTKSVEDELSRSERRARKLQSNLEEARKVADEDFLTGLPNRRAFEHVLDRELRTAQENDDPLCVAFCDIDHFKRINDTHGHAAGDRVLKAVADMLGQISNDRCCVARHGGEEFAVLFRGVALEEAWRRLDEAREEMAQRRLVNRSTDTPFGRVTFSAGIADMMAYPDKRAALTAADRALYAAKEDGRNQIVIATTEAGESLGD